MSSSYASHGKSRVRTEKLIPLTFPKFSREFQETKSTKGNNMFIDINQTNRDYRAFWPITIKDSGYQTFSVVDGGVNYVLGTNTKLCDPKVLDNAKDYVSQNVQSCLGSEPSFFGKVERLDTDKNVYADTGITLFKFQANDGVKVDGSSFPGTPVVVFCDATGKFDHVDPAWGNVLPEIIRKTGI